MDLRSLSRALSVRALSVRALCVLALAAPGCSLILDAPEEFSNRCVSDGDCGASSCDAHLGMCVSEAEEAYAYLLAITIPADEGAGRPSQTRNVGPFAIGPAAQALVPRPVPIVGTVRTSEQVIDADIVFTRVGDETPGPPVAPIVVSAAPPDDLGLERMTDFVTEIVPGRYDLEVRPRGEHAATIPPFRATVDIERGRNVDLLLPLDYTILQGAVVDPSGVPQNGLEVRAIEVETGRRVSSIATTSSRADTGAGGFALRIAPGARRWVLQVSAPPEYQERARFPVVAIDPSVLVQVDGRVQLLVPSPEDGRCFAGTVELPISAQPARGASVTLRSQELRDVETGIAGRFTVQMTTTIGGETEIGCSGAPLPAGGFEARVLPGTYDIEIRPLDESAAILVGQVVIGDTDHLGQIFQLPLRTVVAGVVRRDADRPLADARVRAIALGAPLPFERLRPEALLNRSNEALTDATGRFALPLDVGVYDLVVEPPAGSNFPWRVAPAYGIGGSADGPTEPFDVRTPVAVRGEALYADGEALDGAQIEAFAIVGIDGRQRPVPIGRARTEADGSFLLLLPPAI